MAPAPENKTPFERLLELGHLLDQQLHPVQVGGNELGIGADRTLELVERLVDAALVPVDLATPVVGLGASRMHAQRFVEPGKSLLDPAAVGSLHGLIQTVPVAVFVVSHLGSDPSGAGRW